MTDLEMRLIQAAKDGNEHMVRRLLRDGADVNAKDDADGTALMYAAYAGYTDIAKMLIENGANIDLQDKDNWTALHFAAYLENDDIVKILLECGAKVNLQTKSGLTALHFAAYSENDDIVKTLLEKGAEVDLQDKNGLTPLMIAVRWQRYTMVKMLIENGANINLQDKDNWTALHFAVRYLENDDIVKTLLKEGAEVNLQNKNGLTPLMLAVRWQKYTMVKMLLERGANIDLQDKDNWTALHFAVNLENDDIVKTLLEKGAKVDLQDKNNRTVLHFAVNLENEDIVKMLLESGAKVDLQNKNAWTPLIDENGKTALMRALENKKNDLAMYLIMNGEDLGKTDNKGNGVLKYLLKNGDLGLLKVAFGRKINEDQMSSTFSQSEINLALNANIAAVNDFVKENSSIDENIIRILLENGLDVNKVEKNFTIRLKKCNDEEKAEIFGSINTLIQSNPDVASKVLSKNIAGIDVIKKGNNYEIILRDKRTKKACLRYGCKLEGERYTFEERKKEHHFFRLARGMKKFIKHIYGATTLVATTYQGLKQISEELGKRRIESKREKVVPGRVEKNSKNRER